jgi:hypothetical protein
MSVNVLFRGRLGNNLFQYALGRILAENLGLALDCRYVAPLVPEASKYLKLAGPSRLDELLGYFPGVALRLAGIEAADPAQSFVVAQGKPWTGQKIDFAAILADRSPRRIDLHGYFQRFEYFDGRESDIRRWFALAPIATAFDVTRRDVLINIRRGLDFGLFGWILPLSYYDRALASVADVGQVYICGTGINDGVREHFKRLRPIYFQGTPVEHFSFMTRFSTVVLSNSTFAWWAAYLSNAESVYAPSAVDSRGYAFTGFADVDLHMRQSRYHEVPVVAFARTDTYITIGPRPQASRKTQVLGVSGRCTADSDALAWMLARPGAILSLSDVTTRHPMANAKSLISEMARSGLLTVSHTYAEP